MPSKLRTGFPEARCQVTNRGDRNEPTTSASPSSGGLAVVLIVRTLARAVMAAGDVAYGYSSSNDDPTQLALKSYFTNLQRGEGDFAELDAIEAALAMTGGEAAAALVAWGTFAAIGEAYTDLQ